MVLVRVFGIQLGVSFCGRGDEANCFDRQEAEGQHSAQHEPTVRRERAEEELR